MELFDYIKVLFSLSDDWDYVSSSEKEKHFFMLNRIMAIAFPCLVDELQDLKTNKIDASDFWHKHMTKTYRGRIPRWVYTKYKASSDSSTKPVISKERLERYADYHNAEMRDIYDALKFFPDELINSVKQFEKKMK